MMNYLWYLSVFTSLSGIYQQPDPNTTEINAKNLIDLGRFSDHAPKTEKNHNSRCAKEATSTDKYFTQTSALVSHTSNTPPFAILVSFLTQCNSQCQRAMLPAVKPLTSHASAGQFKKRNVTLWTAAKKTSAGGDGKGWECLRMEKEKRLGL